MSVPPHRYWSKIDAAAQESNCRSQADGNTSISQTGCASLRSPMSPARVVVLTAGRAVTQAASKNVLNRMSVSFYFASLFCHLII